MATFFSLDGWALVPEKSETEVVVNGDFSADSDWIKGDGATISGGSLSYDGTQVANSLTVQSLSLESNDTVRAFITVSGISAGSVRLVFGDDSSLWIDTDGDYYFELKSDGTDDIAVEADTDFIGNIESVSMLKPNGKYANQLEPLWNVQTRGKTPTPSSNKSNVHTADAMPWSIIAGPYEPVAGRDVDLTIDKNQHNDFHFRLWVIPTILQLSNPQLNTNIGFRLWKTWTDPETISSVLVNGSSVLTFDISPGDVIKDSQYRLVNMQIGPGEPTVEAEVQFNTENLQGILSVIALISDTFNLIPDVPVQEAWEYKTDIITNYKGSEQRISLRRYPRYEQNFEVEIIDMRQRKEQYDILRRNIAVQSLVPLYQYATHLTGVTPIGGTKIYFDPARTNMRAGEFIIIVNPSTEGVGISKIDSVDADGATISSAAGEEYTSSWVAMPALNCLLNDGSGITMNNVTGRLKINAKSFTEPDILRPNATRTFEEFEGTPVLDRRPIIPAEESFSYRREVFDNETGVRDVNSRDLHPIVEGKRTFVIQRVSDPDEMDYWRSFFDRIRGAQESFLFATFFPDLTLVGSQTPFPQGFSGMVVNETRYPSIFQQYGTWEHIQIEYETGKRSFHRVSLAEINEEGTVNISMSPAAPDDPDYTVPVRISFLMRVRASDRVVFSHWENYSEVSFDIITTDV